MNDPLNDGHVSLEAESANVEAEFSPEQNASVFKFDLLESFNQQTEFDDIDDYFYFQLERARQVSFQSVSNPKQAGPELEGIFPAAIYWGTMENNLGYINITRMFLFDETIDIDNDDLDIEDEIQALNSILDEVMTDLQDTNALVIDVRSNGGGTDSGSLEIVNRFATSEHMVFSKFAGSFNRESTIKQAFTTPATNPYTGPVAVLTSLDSASATEIFLLCRESILH